MPLNHLEPNEGGEEKKVSNCCKAPMGYIDEFLCCLKCGESCSPIAEEKEGWEDDLRSKVVGATDHDGEIYYEGFKELKSFIFSETESAYKQGKNDGRVEEAIGCDLHVQKALEEQKERIVKEIEKMGTFTTKFEDGSISEQMVSKPQVINLINEHQTRQTKP